ncbi:SiaB family protein kinase [Halarcobacter sp.]|uniref:SiaB family protein kinase n=1 Tax=Halarcobacter sp. TaxID=2321133 RepID=UPI0029F50447|nr:SiaB family protein kinase [Halarcobacter sp.]
MNIKMIQDIVEEDGIIFLTYGGFLSQSLISSMMEALEKEAKESDLNLGVASNIFTIFIELTQNMMNYSKTKNADCDKLNPQGLIVVTKDLEENYFIHSQNIITQKDKDKIQPKLEELIDLDREGVKKRYRELRRSGKDTHGKGGGIGFYEIAKRSDEIKFSFREINKDKFYFHFIAKIVTNKEK